VSRHHLPLTAPIAALTLCLITAGCSSTPVPKEPSMTASDNAAAKKVWQEMNAEAESAQATLEGDWLASDTAARACGSGGAQWVITRFGPGTEAAHRDDLLKELSTRWSAKGWNPTRSTITGDAPGVQLRYPDSVSLNNGFFVEFRTTEHGSSLQIQTPCTPGDVDQLNREKYAEKHTNTPPDIPGASSPSAEATP
jgi:hypothetical protein